MRIAAREQPAIRVTDEVNLSNAEAIVQVTEKAREVFARVVDVTDRVHGHMRGQWIRSFAEPAKTADVGFADL